MARWESWYKNLEPVRSDRVQLGETNLKIRAFLIELFVEKHPGTWHSDVLSLSYTTVTSTFLGPKGERGGGMRETFRNNVEIVYLVTGRPGSLRD